MTDDTPIRDQHQQAGPSPELGQRLASQAESRPASDEAEASPKREAMRRVVARGDGTESARDGAASGAGQVFKAVERTPEAIEAERASRFSMEALIGSRVFAAAGALAVVVAAILFARHAWHEGWFGLVPPAARCGGIAAFGALLIGLGELFRKRLGAWSTAGMTAAGLGTLYVAAWMSFAHFELVSNAAAFAMLAGVSGLGFALGARSRLVFVAILSLIGGYAALVLAPAANPPMLALPAYLLMLATVSLGLAAYGPKRFGLLREVSLVGTGVIGTLWILTTPASAGLAAAGVGFAAVAWLLFTAEVFVATGRSERDGRLGLDPGAGLHRAHASAVTWTMTTWSAVVASLAVERTGRPDVVDSWLVLAGYSAVTLVTGLIAAGHLRVLSDRPGTTRERIGIAALLQSGGLGAAALILAVAGPAESVATAVLGLAAVFAARATGVRVLNVHGFALLTWAIVRTAAWDSWTTNLLATGVEFAGVRLTLWTALASVVGLLGVYGGVVIGRSVRKPERAASRCLMLTGGVLLLASMVPGSSAGGLSVLLGLCGLVAAGVQYVRPRVGADVVAVLTLAAAFGGYLLAMATGWLSYDAPPMLHPALLAGLVISASAIANAMVWRKRPGSVGQQPMSVVLTWAGAAVFVLTTSVEVFRSAGLIFEDAVAAQRAMVSVWWAVLGTVAIVGGLRQRIEDLRWVGLGMVGVALGKVLLFDMATLESEWRIVSLVVVGLAMLTVAAVYGRVGMRAKAKRDELVESGCDEESEGSPVLQS